MEICTDRSFDNSIVISAYKTSNRICDQYLEKTTQYYVRLFNNKNNIFSERYNQLAGRRQLEINDPALLGIEIIHQAIPVDRVKDWKWFTPASCSSTS